MARRKNPGEERYLESKRVAALEVEMDEGTERALRQFAQKIRVALEFMVEHGVVRGEGIEAQVIVDDIRTVKYTNEQFGAFNTASHTLRRRDNCSFCFTSLPKPPGKKEHSRAWLTCKYNEFIRLCQEFNVEIPAGKLPTQTNVERIQASSQSADRNIQTLNAI